MIETAVVYIVLQYNQFCKNFSWNYFLKANESTQTNALIPTLHFKPHFIKVEIMQILIHSTDHIK